MQRATGIAEVWARALVAKWRHRAQVHKVTGRLQNNIHLLITQTGDIFFAGARIKMGRMWRDYGAFVVSRPYTPPADVEYADVSSPRARRFFFTEGFYSDAFSLKLAIHRYLFKRGEAALHSVTSSEPIPFNLDEVCQKLSDALTSELLGIN